jgi:hypothetical protein
MSTFTVQMFHHFDKSEGSNERIAEIAGPDGFGGRIRAYYRANYIDSAQVAERVAAATGMDLASIKILRTVEPSDDEFALFGRIADQDVDLAARLDTFR